MTTCSATIDIPKFPTGYKFRMDLNWQVGPTSIGCHTQQLFSLSCYGAELPSSTYFVKPQKPDKEIEAQIARDVNAYGGCIIGSITDLALKDAFETQKDVYMGVIRNNMPENIPFLIMSNHVNKEKMTSFITVAGFAKWLIDKKIGVVTETPMVLNPLHNTPRDVSICQVWIWTPPSRCEFGVKDSGRVWNRKNLPDIDTFASNLHKDWKRFTPSAYKQPYKEVSDVRSRLDPVYR